MSSLFLPFLEFWNRLYSIQLYEGSGQLASQLLNGTGILAFNRAGKPYGKNVTIRNTGNTSTGNISVNVGRVTIGGITLVPEVKFFVVPPDDAVSGFVGPIPAGGAPGSFFLYVTDNSWNVNTGTICSATITLTYGGGTRTTYTFTATYTKP